jgi:hypothetical protein
MDNIESEFDRFEQRHNALWTEAFDRLSADKPVADIQKDIHVNISKFIRTLERVKDDNCLNESLENDLVNLAIQSHFIRTGQFDTADTFAKEANINSDKSVFVEMHSILDAMDTSLDPCLNWCLKNQDVKGVKDLQFQLHKANFISFLQSNQLKVALEYAKSHFNSYSDSNLKEIQQLMTSILFKNKNKYNYDISQIKSDIKYLFSNLFCQNLGLSPESPLYVALNVGVTAIPRLQKSQKVLKKGVEWSQQGELPVEVELADNQRWHSVFVCPVSKEQATEENPAMLMICITRYFSKL